MSTIAWLILVISASANYVIPLFPIYQQLFPLSTGMMTTLFSVYLLSLIPFLLSAHKLLQRFSAFQLAGMSLGFALLSVVIGLFNNSLLGLFLMRILQGAGIGLFMGIIHPLFMENITANEQLKSSKLTGTMTLLGFGLGPLICSITAELLLDKAILSALIALGIILFSGLMIWLSLNRTKSPDRQNSFDTTATALQIPKVFWQVIVPAVVTMYALNGPVLSLLPSYTRTLLHTKNLIVSGSLMFVLLSGGLLLQKLPWVKEPFKRLQLGLIFLLMGISCVILGGFYGKLIWLIIGIVCHAVATNWIYPSAITLTSQLVDAKVRTRLLIVLYIMGYLGLGIPTVIIGQIANHLGMVNALCCGLIVAIVVSLWVIMRAQYFKNEFE